MGLKAERPHTTTNTAKSRSTKQRKRPKRAPRKIYYVSPPGEKQLRIMAELEAKGIIRRPKGTLEEQLAGLDRLLEGDEAEQKETGRFLREALKNGGVEI
jgi:hypothetical protein